MNRSNPACVQPSRSQTPPRVDGDAPGHTTRRQTGVQRYAGMVIHEQHNSLSPIQNRLQRFCRLCPFNDSLRRHRFVSPNLCAGGRQLANHLHSRALAQVVDVSLVSQAKRGNLCAFQPAAEGLADDLGDVARLVVVDPPGGLKSGA